MQERWLAFLTSDWLVLSSVVSIGYLESRLQAAGLKTRRLSDQGAVIEVSSGNHAIHLNRTSIEDTLLEGMTIDTWARALAAWAVEPGFVGQGELVISLT